jgi:N-formylglutamate deformylase
MEIFKLHLPGTATLPIVANLPHSGTYIPPDIERLFTGSHRLSLPNTDWHLSQLYDFLPSLGITVLEATHSRYVIDLNRDPYATLFGSFWSSLIPSTTAKGDRIYQTLPNSEHLESRLKKYYEPYHQKLVSLLQELRAKFKTVYLLDLHSFMGPITSDVCLGDRNGQSCSEALISSFEKNFRDEGFKVVRNQKFIGGYNTKYYSSLTNVEALQIEIRYTTYLNNWELDLPKPPSSDTSAINKAKEKLLTIFSNAINSLALKEAKI